MTKKWTKAEALQKFIDDRVLGDVGFAYDQELDSCTYNHKVNGGCAIGCLLPEDVASGLSQTLTITVQVNGNRLDRFLDDPNSVFWPTLQKAHDTLARHVLRFGPPPSYQSQILVIFQGYLLEAARLADGEEAR